jgi:hypothetical protein
VTQERHRPYLVLESGVHIRLRLPPQSDLRMAFLFDIGVEQNSKSKLINLIPRFRAELNNHQYKSGGHLACPPEIFNLVVVLRSAFRNINYSYGGK